MQRSRIEKALASLRPASTSAPRARVVVLLKADVKNPGSRGGKFSRTRTGKVAYGQTSTGKKIGHPRETVDAAQSAFGGTSHIKMHQNHPGWDSADHREAAAHHDAQADAHKGGDRAMEIAHRDAALAHTIAADFPAAFDAVEKHLRSADGVTTSRDTTPMGRKPRLVGQKGSFMVGLIAEMDGGLSVRWADSDGGPPQVSRFTDAKAAAVEMARVLKEGPSAMAAGAPK